VTRRNFKILSVLQETEAIDKSDGRTVLSFLVILGSETVWLRASLAREQPIALPLGSPIPSSKRNSRLKRLFFTMNLEPEEVKPILKLAALAAVVLTAGCATDHHITHAESMKMTVRGNGLMHYATQIRDAITDEMPMANFDGMRCTVRLQLARDGMVLNARSEGGDAILCDAALKAVQVAKIPPAPSDEVYQAFKTAPLDFQY